MGYLEFQNCKDEHIQFSFYFKSGHYDKDTDIWEWIVRPDKLFIDGELTNEYKKISGKNVSCSLDSGSLCGSCFDILTGNSGEYKKIILKDICVPC